MTRLVICGQAPSRLGDGRAFTGPSGRRLADLFDLRDYEQLAMRHALINIFDRPAVRKTLPARRSAKRNSPGDTWDREAAVERAERIMAHWIHYHHNYDPVVMIACGHNVYRALTGTTTDLFRGRRVSGVQVWLFPHPSGASQFWNDPENVRDAHEFLKKLLNRSSLKWGR